MKIHMLPYSELVDRIEGVHAGIARLIKCDLPPEATELAKAALIRERDEYFYSIGALMSFQTIEQRHGRMTNIESVHQRAQATTQPQEKP